MGIHQGLNNYRTSWGFLGPALDTDAIPAHHAHPGTDFPAKGRSATGAAGVLHFLVGRGTFFVAAHGRPSEE
jgi:hypothetical protein